VPTYSEVADLKMVYLNSDGSYSPGFDGQPARCDFFGQRSGGRGLGSE
jgi:hypothetical protein